MTSKIKYSKSNKEKKNEKILKIFIAFIFFIIVKTIFSDWEHFKAGLFGTF